MEKSQRTFQEFEDAIRTELLRRLNAGELTEEEIIEINKEKMLDNETMQ